MNYSFSEKSIASFYQPSVTTDEIDKAVHKMIIDAGAYPSPLGYGGFPKSVCTSVNECMCHGIPDSRELQVQKVALDMFCAYFRAFPQLHF
jgi:methionine aminopeptidase